MVGALLVGSPLDNVTAISLRQALTPDALLGRVVASARMIAVGTPPPGALLGGILAQAIGLRSTLLVAAGWMLTKWQIRRNARRNDMVRPAWYPSRHASLGYRTSISPAWST